MKGRPKTERIDVSLEGLRAVHRRIGAKKLEEGDWPLMGALVVQLMGRIESQQERMIAKIQADAAKQQAQQANDLAGDACHPDCDCHGEASGATSGGEASATGDVGGWKFPAPSQPTNPSDPSADQPNPDGKDGKVKAKGHGRNGAGAYTAAQHVFYTLAAGILGMICERCGAGRMSRCREKIVIRVVGQPLFAALLHHYERARCKACGYVVSATGAAHVLEGIGTSYVMYDWSACAMLVVMHYFAGAPFKRLESLHQSWGIPLADANQWQLVDKVHDLLLPLYRALERYAIQRATSFRIDDTGSMIVSLAKRIRDEIAVLKLAGESTNHVRTGINATGVYWETPEGPIILFFTGLHHAGEIVDQLLQHRPASGSKLVKVTDGASKNFDHAQQDQLDEASCNAHALLKFVAIKDKFPSEYAKVGEIYKEVFDHDDQAKALGLDPVQRMIYHRQHSEPLMLRLKKMCQEKIKSKLVEPNSALWEPLSFIINQWDRLTRFYQVPGVALDSNLVEQTLIMVTRYLAGSFNYQTEDGAVVGDRLMSLIATARADDVEPVAYLTECLRCHDDLARRPEYYLPWVYRERLKTKQQTSPPAAPQHPPTPASDRFGPPSTLMPLGAIAPETHTGPDLRPRSAPAAHARAVPNTVPSRLPGAMQRNSPSTDASCTASIRCHHNEECAASADSCF